MKYIDGGICAAKGFKASGTYCGIKKPNVENFDPQIKHKNDICLFTSYVLCNAAAYTVRCSACQRLPPSARMARWNEVAASASNTTKASVPTRMKGRLTMSAKISGRSSPMSSQL